MSNLAMELLLLNEYRASVSITRMKGKEVEEERREVENKFTALRSRHL